MMSSKNERLMALEKAIVSINKSIKSDITEKPITKLSDAPLEVPTISTGSLVLDSISGGGFPKGRIIEIYGPEASGKTSIALTAVGNVQRDGGTAVFIDLENALDPRYAKKLGVKVDELFIAQPDHAEQALDLIENLVNTGNVDLIVLDSVAALVPKQELEGSAEDVTIGLVARLLSKSLKKLVASANRNKTTVIFINQVRDKIGGFSPYGTPETTSGGRALKFFASQRIDVRRRGQVKDGKDIIGNEIKLSIKKNKIAPPFGEGTTILTFNHGINRAAELVETGDEIGVILRPNNRKYIEEETGEIIGNSKAEALHRLENDKEMFDRISKRVAEILRDPEERDKKREENAESKAQKNSSEDD